ncbi:MAG: methionine synthase [Phycisphaerales bacterium]|nr:MAG: methionine synthase [Phycisphaerales bacterium]
MFNPNILDVLRDRVLVLDGAMGTSIHALDLPLSDYDGLENCNEVLVLTRPDAIADIHRSFLAVGCDAVQTNTFGGSKHVLQEFGLADRTREINRRAAMIAREVAEGFRTDSMPRFVIGSVGPGTKLASLGQTDWDTLVDSYTEQILGLVEGGVDAVNIETCQDILQPKAVLCAARRAMKELGRRVPLMVSVTMETTGTMLIGTDIAAALTAIEAYPDVGVIGVNCATGPQEMSEHVRHLGRHCTRFVSVQPNAGLPEVIDGKPVYRLTPDELARWLVEFVEINGVNLVGGCCGTTPEHMAAVVEAIGGRAPIQREPQWEPAVSSLYQAATVRQELSFLIIGERTNANGSKKFREAMLAGDLDSLVAIGRDEVKGGAHMIDVCAAYTGRDEVEDLRRIITRFRTDISVPLMIDSTEPPAIEAALKLVGGKCAINSINLEAGEERMAEVCELACRFGATLVALTIDEEGMAKEADRKLAVAKRIYELATKEYGIAAGDLMFDPLTFTICTGMEDDRRLAVETLEGIRLIKKHLPEVHTVLGASNVSFGLNPTARQMLNSVFLHYAREAGLDAAIVHASKILPLYRVDEEHREAARRLIFDRRDEVEDPLAAYMALFEEARTAERAAPVETVCVEERLKNRIIDGDRVGLEDDLAEAIGRHKPLDIVNNILLEGMKVVGELFGSGQMQLPFVLQSAETMKAAVVFLEPRMEKAEGRKKGRVILATVQGDVHDIGKNLVDILLTNNGYEVMNLGIKQPIAAILAAYQEHGADAIGMSGLLVKSTVVMRDNLEIMTERGLDVPVLLGGAALTRKYVEQDLRAIYGGPLYYAKDAFEGLRLMDLVCADHGRVDPEVQAVLAPEQPARKPLRGVLEVREEKAAALPRSSISTTVPVPAPPFWGSRVVEVPLGDALAYINEVMLFQMQWQFKKLGRPAEEFRRHIETEVRPIYRKLVERCEREHILQPRAVYGYWPARSEGQSLIVYDPQDHDREVTRFTFPRQTKPPYWCLSDFFRPVESEAKDVLPIAICTVGQQASDVARHWFENNRYRDYLFLHGLSVEAAEALTEYIHKRVRQELKIGGQDAGELRKLLQQGYQGCRYSFGYPACPELEDQAKLWEILQPADIGVELTEEYQLLPEQTTTALICHHPEARYFKA